MNLNKKELGLKIKQYRKLQKITQENLCGDEAILTTRQLQRIENGKNLPSLESFLYIVKQLSISIEEILEINF